MAPQDGYLGDPCGARRHARHAVRARLYAHSEEARGFVARAPSRYLSRGTRCVTAGSGSGHARERRAAPGGSCRAANAPAPREDVLLKAREAEHLVIQIGAYTLAPQLRLYSLGSRGGCGAIAPLLLLARALLAGLLTAGGRSRGLLCVLLRAVDEPVVVEFRPQLRADLQLSRVRYDVTVKLAIAERAQVVVLLRGLGDGGAARH
mmetsp:Transcript_25966/g.70238  ORF Transcript_25966/g.70238 Transcript_25966/m.70238 type:complete len:206 (-) Transcript_25966:1059-1676(-)